MLDARHAALAIDDPETHLHNLSTAIRQAGMTPAEGNDLLTQAWEAAVEGVLEDELLTLDEENALNRYMRHCNLKRDQLDMNGVLTQVFKSAVLRDTAEGITPNRHNITGRVPFNLMKSEGLVWMMQDVDYYEIKTRRERCGTSHGLRIRIARGV